MDSRLDMSEAFRPRVRRLVAVIRAFFAALSLLAIWLDPNQPSAFPALCYWLLAVYTAYSAVLAAFRFSSATAQGRWDDLLILVDVVVLSTVMFLTDGPTSPFFVWFNFILVSVMLTRGWRPAALVSLLLTGTYVFGSLLFVEVTGSDAAFQLNRFLIRSGYLAASGLMLAYYSREQDRLNREIARVFGWTGRTEAAPLSPLEQALAHALDVLGADRALLLWEDSEEPGVHLARLDAHGFRRETLVEAPALDEEGDQLLDRGDPVAAEVVAALGRCALLSYPVDIADGRARLFVGRERDFDADAFALGRLIAVQVATGLQRTAALDTLAEAVAMQDRVRVARDLHDGTLQSLAGTSLHLQAMLAAHPDLQPDLRARIERLQALLVDEQRQLRGFIDRLRPLRVAPAGPAPIAPELDALAARLAERWRIDVRCTVSPPDLLAPEAFRFELAQLIQEAVANAVRHGGAGAVQIEVARQGDTLAVAVRDDGTGVEPRGCFDAKAVKRQGLGSRSLAGRVEQLGGEMALDSRAGGLHVAITLPWAGQD